MLPVLANRILPRLYDLRSLVLNAFSSMGSVLNAKIVVEIVPAMTGRLMSIVFSLAHPGGAYCPRTLGYVLERADSCPQWGIAMGYFISPSLPGRKWSLIEQAQFPGFVGSFGAVADA